MMGLVVSWAVFGVAAGCMVWGASPYALGLQAALSLFLAAWCSYMHRALEQERIVAGLLEAEVERLEAEVRPQ